MLTQSEYRVLCALQDNENACAEDIAHELGMEPRAITRALAALTRAGYLRDNATLTDVGKMAFQPYQICDAMYHAQGFDQTFIEVMATDVLVNICSALGCARGDIVDIRPLKRGLTNLSFYFSCKGRGYVYRYPGAGTDEIINRAAEAHALKAAAKLGLDTSFICEDEQRGWKISRYIPDCAPFDYDDGRQVTRALSAIRRLHESGETSPWSFDFYDESAKLEELLADSGWEVPEGYEETKRKAARACEIMREGASEPVLCHNDFYGPNILVHGSDMCIIDWEYAAMGDYGCDFGNFIAQGSGYTVERACDAMAQYFGRKATPRERVHLIACTAVVGWYWYVWALFKESKGSPVGEWASVWKRAANEFADAAVELSWAGEGEQGARADALTFEEFTVLAGAEAASRGAVHPETVDEEAARAARESLSARGYLDGDAVTIAGMTALEPYRARRAVLLAAGFGSRLLPVTVNTPKPLARVHGVRIIDRLIDALLAADIDEIYVVRGYLAEEFDQLKAKYPMIRFIENPLYGETNNISSAVAACSHFEGAYIFESDLFLANPNLVSKYQYRTNYLAFPVDATDDWYFDVTDVGVVEHLAKGKGAPCWQMVGLSFWTPADGRKLAHDIPHVFARDDAKQIFWDDVAIERCPENYEIHVRRCDPEDIVEIDDFDDLRRIDPAYVVRHKDAERV